MGRFANIIKSVDKKRLSGEGGTYLEVC
jgi:hypothetical protein